MGQQCPQEKHAVVIELFVQPSIGFANSLVENTAQVARWTFVFILTLWKFNRASGEIIDLRSMDSCGRLSPACRRGLSLSGRMTVSARIRAAHASAGPASGWPSSGQARDAGDKRRENLAGGVAFGAGKHGPEVSLIIIFHRPDRPNRAILT